MRTRLKIEHKLKVVKQAGNLVIYGCMKCKERNLAKDMVEAKEIFEKTRCE